MTTLYVREGENFREDGAQDVPDRKRHRLIEYVELFRRTIDGAQVQPREVVKEALNRNAAAVIFCHCHPSGVASSSQADASKSR